MYVYNVCLGVSKNIIYLRIYEYAFICILVRMIEWMNIRFSEFVSESILVCINLFVCMNVCVSVICMYVQPHLPWASEKVAGTASFSMLIALVTGNLLYRLWVLYYAHRLYRL